MTPLVGTCFLMITGKKKETGKHGLVLSALLGLNIRRIIAF